MGSITNTQLKYGAGYRPPSVADVQKSFPPPPEISIKAHPAATPTIQAAGVDMSSAIGMFQSAAANIANAYPSILSDYAAYSERGRWASMDYFQRAVDASKEVPGLALDYTKQIFGLMDDDSNFDVRSVYSEVGGRAMLELENVVTGISDPESVQQKLTSLPGYQFQMQQGQQALERSQAAKGGLLGGGALAEAARYGQGFAENAYQQYIQNVQNIAQLGSPAEVARLNALSEQNAWKRGLLSSAFAGGLSSLFNTPTLLQEQAKYLGDYDLNTAGTRLATNLKGLDAQTGLLSQAANLQSTGLLQNAQYQQNAAMQTAQYEYDAAKAAEAQQLQIELANQQAENAAQARAVDLTKKLASSVSV